MIDWIAIRHFAITAAVELELDSGFTTITGETGSGKSLMVDALAILLGARAENSLIQHGQEQAEIQCSFNLPADHAAMQWLKTNQLDSDGELLLRRTIRRNKAGRGYINGNPVNISMLRELGKDLVDIHGQHELHSLMRTQVQQNLLDSIADNSRLLAEIGDCYDQYRELAKQLQQVEREGASIQERIELLKFQLIELEQLQPQVGEWENLAQQQKKLSNVHELASGCEAIANKLYLDEGDSVHNVLVRQIAQLGALQHYDQELGAIVTMLEESIVNVEEASKQLRDYYESAELDPAQREQIEQRFSSYHQLSRKHRIQPTLLAEHTATLRAELASLHDPEAERQRLEELIPQQRVVYHQLASKLTETRRHASNKLATAITAAMQQLGMAGGVFEITLQSLAADQMSKTGNERIEFMVSANPGLPVQPLAKVASGGELSRISLAIQVILADAAKVPTLIFDEVDVGISGTVANVVGDRLRQLGKSNQVICVTHLAQVAARGNQHYAVTKTSAKNTNAIDVRVTRLSEDDRIIEIARMAGSQELTSQARAHAEQLLTHRDD